MNFYDKPSPQILCHHGVKKQQWGVRNGPPYPLGEDSGSTPRYDYGKMGLSTDSLPTLRLPKQEYAHVMSEVATHISSEQRSEPIFMKHIGSHVYTFENGFDGTFRVIGKDEINPRARDYYNRRGKDE